MTRTVQLLLFRHNAIKNLLAEAAKFDKATYMTAPLLSRSMF